MNWTNALWFVRIVIKKYIIVKMHLSYNGIIEVFQTYDVSSILTRCSNLFSV
ncbi:hypothetical protein LAh6_59 [Aeromonas phage LAh_6]|uniref:Uncharacterized protein n=1 Tax=Aeromonas phage LAh_6 TaxID=2591030 RepID=A0A514A058_9CAUD|nr:hypothetical protein HWC30_gp059 [Aeromonas phage LAh_6]QDH46625.1 hypothetical protein LAh6_59 [Aeromonas phage LAh_6]